ncbi:MAG: hypothetical protein ACFFDF_01535 [Candidatus Odinarchaeota archaeon]
MIKIKIKKIKKKIPAFIVFLIIAISLGFATIDGSACLNGPNYWGDGWPNYPGDATATGYRHPENPSKYIVANQTIPNSQTYDGSHYGTHDWIADAALRSLRDPIKNPFGFDDWTWLINHEIATNKWPVWNLNYGNDAQHHVKVRGYFTFLFATQMPDMDLKKAKLGDEEYYPQKIAIPQEGVVIKDFGLRNKWVGKTEYHSYHFLPTPLEDGNSVFVPIKTSPASKAQMLGEEAIKCIGKKVKDEQGYFKSAMQPEGATGWLGAMTHYFADLIVPAHLLSSGSYSPDIYYSGYHNWFENHLGSLTKWDKAFQVGNGGPEATYFSWDIGIIGMIGKATGFIIPIRPDIAIHSLARHTIEIAYSIDGNHQHIEWNGNNDDIAKNSGLYLNTKQNNWNWKLDLDTNGRINSLHRYFYDKVEKLLCWAIYYTACAMQYCFNEGKKKSEDTPGLNPDYWVTRDPSDVPRQIPVEGPQRRIDDFFGDLGSSNDRFSRFFRNLGVLAAPLLIAIASMLRKTFFMIGR